MSKTVTQTPSPTYVYVSMYAQEEKEERVYTRCLTLDSFWGGRGGAETGAPVSGEGRRDSQAKSPRLLPNPTVCAHSYACMSEHLESNCFRT